MQITIQLLGNGIRLPIAANESIQGLIYNALRNDPYYSYRIHNEGLHFQGRKYKLFTFGDAEGKYSVHDGIIEYLNGLLITVRSVDPYFIQLIFSYFTHRNEVRLGNNTVTVGKVNLLDDRVFDSRITVKTKSPVTAYVTEEDGHTTYFSPDDERFYDSIITNARRKWASAYGNEEGFDLKVHGTDTRYIKRATRFKSTYITAWHGCFVLEGPPRVLDFLYRTGIGSKNSQGFGMFDIK